MQPQYHVSCRFYKWTVLSEIPITGNIYWLYWYMLNDLDVICFWCNPLFVLTFMFTFQMIHLNLIISYMPNVKTNTPISFIFGSIQCLLWDKSTNFFCKFFLGYVLNVIISHQQFKDFLFCGEMDSLPYLTITRCIK